MATYSLEEIASDGGKKKTYSLQDVAAGEQMTPSENVGGRLSNLIEGAGLAIKAPYVGVKGMFADDGGDGVRQFKQAIDANSRRPGGFGGQVLGGGIVSAPLMMIPGAQGLGAQTAIGGLYGAAYPAETASERAQNALSGAAGSLVGYGAGRLINGAGKGFLTAAQQKAEAEASKNAMRDTVLANGREAGYVIPRSEYDPSFLSNRLESVGGKAAIKQEATHRNQEVTNSLVKKDLGIPDDQPISLGALEGIRKDAGKAYQEVAGLNPVAASDLEALKQARSDAKQWFNAYNRSADPSQLAKAKEYNDISAMLEQSLEGHAVKAGRDDLIPALREARKTIAQTYTAEQALNKATGDISAPVLGRLFDKQKPLSGGMKQAGEFNSAFPKFTGAGASTPAAGVSKSEAIMGTLLGAGGAAMTGSPVGMLAATIPLLSHPARSLALSNIMQTPKKYPVGLLPQMPGRLANGMPLGGAAGAIGLLNE